MQKSIIIDCKRCGLNDYCNCKSYSRFYFSKNNLLIDERDVYVYGYEIIISTGITFLLLILTGLLFGLLSESVVFFFVFYLLRRRTGGFHADTYFKCNFIFELNVIFAMILASLNIVFYTKITINAISFLLCFVLTIIKAPISNPNKPISKNMRKRHQVCAIVLVIFFELLSIVAFNIGSISICMSLAMASTAFAMMINSEEKRNSV